MRQRDGSSVCGQTEEPSLCLALEHSDEEDRYITIGLVHDILYVVYCDRDNPETGETDTRLISARKAKGWEIALYNDNIQGRY